MPEKARRIASTVMIGVALFAVSFGISRLAMRDYRAAGAKPSFYQSTFEAAVMMACGRGFGEASVPTPELDAFLLTRSDTFDCALLASAPTRPLTTAANANWYYLYRTAAAVWRVTGVSWTALDSLVSAMAGIVTVLVYALFRVVAGRGSAAALSLLLTISPANLSRLQSLRDYSKAPFALAAILILVVLVLRPLTRARQLALAACYGAVLGIGYGFRADLGIMVPFGAIVVLLFLPGGLKVNLVRNGAACAVLLASFVIVSAPVIARLEAGGCQYDFALLGLTTPNSAEMHLTTPLYRLGDHTLDIFGSLKVTDYATRVMHQPIPNLCDAQFDVASGQLYWRMVTTFPADIVVRAYGSVLMILRLGLGIPDALPPWQPFASSAFMTPIFRTLSAVTAMVAPIGVLLVLAAVGVAWAASVRLGVVFTVFVLFLTGYPSIRFEERHWFHLRFIPWFAAAMVVGHLPWRGVHGWPRPALRRAAMGVAGVLMLLGAALSTLRLVQARSVRALVAQYQAAATEDIPVDRQAGSTLPVRWRPVDVGRPPEHEGTDLLVATLDAAHCGGAGPVIVNVRYDVDTIDGGHDLSTTFTLDRPAPGAVPTQLFVPVFWLGFKDHTFLRFSGFGVVGAPAACIGRVARVIDRASVPLWLEMQVPPDWSSRRLYESIDPPRFLKPFVTGPL